MIINALNVALNSMLKTGPWNLSDLETIPKNGLKVFSCFHCGGGSTMGYKLAGFDVLGGVEIDPEMMSVYRANHHPKYSYLMGVQEFKKIPDADLPRELFELDILDGSPPCSSFSMAGSREKKWGKSRKFREGQAVQVLDDLFFDFIEIAKKLQPKVVVAENVKGLIQGNARGYVKEIFAAFREAGYSCQLFLLNAAAMGVPQKRERTFFIANKLDKKVELKFSEKSVIIKDVIEKKDLCGKKIKCEKTNNIYNLVLPGQDFRGVAEKVYGKRSILKQKINSSNVAQTQTATTRLVSDISCNEISDRAVIAIQSFPSDFNFLKHDPVYICGMSVPPFMMQRVANQIAIQFFDKKGLKSGEKTGDA